MGSPEATAPAVEPLTEGELYTLVALGKNWKDGDDTHLSPESIWTTMAAVELARQGKVSTIIFSGGDTAGHGYTEAEAMCDMFLEFRELIPQKHRERLLLIIEPHSFDTAGNAERVANIASALRFQHVALLTARDHMDRSVTLFDTYGLTVTRQFISEDILRKTTAPIGTAADGWHHFQQLFSHTAASPRRLTERVKEMTLNSLLMVDPFGKIPRLITQRSRRANRKGLNGLRAENGFSQPREYLLYYPLHRREAVTIDMRSLMRGVRKGFDGPYVLINPVNPQASFTLEPSNDAPRLRITAGDIPDGIRLRLMALTPQGERVYFSYFLEVEDLKK